MKLYLVVATGKHKGMPILIKRDLFLLGAEPMCQLRSSLPGVGGQHCAVVTRDNKVFIRDLDSGQPTTLNNALVPAGEEWPLHAGDRLEIGPLQFVVQFQERPLSQRDAAEWALTVLDQASEEKKQADEDLYRGGDREDNAATAAASILGGLESTRGAVKGRLRIFDEGDVTVVRLNDEHLVEESEISLIRTELAEQLADTSQRVLLDLKNVKRMSSMAIGMIVNLYRQLKARGVSMALCQMDKEVLPVMEAVGMGKLMPCFPDRPSALRARW